MRAIFAVNARDGFGLSNGRLPWPHSAVDMRRFAQYTSGGTVIMGRATWESPLIPRPLPRRKNIVLSKTLVDSRATVCATIDDVLHAVQNDSSVWVIGGTSVLWALRPYITTVYVSVFNSIDHADIYLDTDRYLLDYEMLSRELHGDHALKIYRRIT